MMDGQSDLFFLERHPVLFTLMVTAALVACALLAGAVGTLIKARAVGLDERLRNRSPLYRKISDRIDERTKAPSEEERAIASARADQVGGYLLGLFVVLFLGWLGTLLVAPNLGVSAPDPKQIAAASRLEHAASLVLETRKLRAEPRQLGNVVLWVGKREFEAVPFPDRKAIVRSLASTWCPAASPLFLPSLYVRDITSGESLARCLCLTAGPSGGTGEPRNPL
jgi:hypothetical protein